jgi:hypothetical protein
VNRLQRIVQPMLDAPPHRVPDLATLDARVRQRARRRQGTRALAAVAGLLVAATALTRPLPTDIVGSRGGSPGATATAGTVGGSVPPAGTAPPPAPNPDFLAAVAIAFPEGVYRPGDLTGRPLVEVKVDPVDAPADAVRTLTFVNRGTTPLETCGVDLARWSEADRFDEGVALGILGDGTVLMGPEDVGGDHFCPDDSEKVPHVKVPPGGSVQVTRRFGSGVAGGAAYSNPGSLKPGIYIITHLRHEEPTVLGRFTVTP